MPAVPGVRFLPNAITALALSTGLTSVVFASKGQWMLAMIAIAASTVLDSLDGPAARMLKSSSRIGAEFDSLSDLSAFGICPAILIYFWQTSLQDVTDQLWLVWGSALVYAVCTALRLARFNSLLDDDEEPKPFAKHFFTGIPSPPGALLVMVPLIAYVEFGRGFYTQIWLVAAWTVLIGLLMVSTVPTIALKSVRVPQKWITPLLVLLVFGLVTFFFQPRIVALIGIALYLLHIPYAIYRYRHLAAHPELWDLDREPRTRRPRRQLRLRVRAANRPSDRLPRRWDDPTVPRQRMRDPRARSVQRREGGRDWNGRRGNG